MHAFVYACNDMHVGMYDRVYACIHAYMHTNTQGWMAATRTYIHIHAHIIMHPAGIPSYTQACTRAFIPTNTCRMQSGTTACIHAFIQT